MITQDLDKMDVAFAKLIFVGEIIDFEGNNAVFEIVEKINGDYPKEKIVVGLPLGYPTNVENFISSYGYFVRLAVTTPDQVELFCPNANESVAENDFLTGPCKYPIRSLNLEQAREVPQLLHNDCAAPYLFRLDKYEIARDYEDKHDDPDDLFQNAFYIGPEITIYKEISNGVYPLPWGHLNWKFETLAVDLFRKNPKFFDENLSKYETDETLLTELGVNLLEISDRLDGSMTSDFYAYVATLDDTEHAQLSEFEIKQRIFESYIVQIVETLKRLDAYIDVDPSFADRLLAVE